MGNAGELCARECQIPRERQDEYAAESYRRALAAVKGGKFSDEIVAVEVPSRKGPATVVSDDEQPFKGDVDKLAGLKPAFDKSGSITAGNASSLNDGASALVVMSREQADRRGVTPLATIRGQAGHAQAPEWFTTAPAGAIAALLVKTGIKVEDVDLWELNEAFAVVALVNREKTWVAMCVARVVSWFCQQAGIMSACRVNPIPTQHARCHVSRACLACTTPTTEISA